MKSVTKSRSQKKDTVVPNLVASLAPLISQLRSLAAAALPAHEDFANAVLQNRITAQRSFP
jgi:hypothetical protein